VLTDTLAALRIVLVGRWVPATPASPASLVKYLDTNLRRLTDMLDKIRTSSGDGGPVARYMRDVEEKWRMAKEADLLEFLERKPPVKMSPR
jgi:hypothetical protein